MNKENDINELLNQIRLSDGSEITFDENAIVEEYHKRGSEESSLAIKVLSIFGGILATFAFLGFVFIARLENYQGVLFALGMVFIVGALCLNFVYKTLIIDTLSISVFIAGFFLVGYGMSQFQIDKNAIIITIMIIAFCSLIINQNYINSFISVLIVNGSILSLIMFNKNFDLIHLYISALAIVLTFVFLKEAKIITTGRKLSKLYNPFRIGLVFSFLTDLVFLGKKGLIPLSSNYIWGSSIITISVLFYLISVLFKIIPVKSLKDKVIIYSICFLMLLPTSLSPAISGAILIIIISFLVNYKAGFVLGIIAFIYFLSQYYYDLNFILLVKSCIMFSSGILFIIFYLFTYKKLGSNE